MDHISIAIVHYNTDAETQACLESLRLLKAKQFEYHICILDNGSKDAFVLPDHLHDLPVEVLRSDTNLGFTGGNNMLMKHALDTHHSDYVLLLNSDTLISADFLEKMWAFAKKNPDVGMMNPLIYFTAGREYHHQSYQKKDLGKVIWFAGGTIDWLNLDSFHRGIDEIDRGQFAHATETDFVTGCCVLVPRKVIEVVGGFDDRYFLYLEDVDWSLRAVQSGFRLALCPAAHIWHTNAGSTGGAGSVVHQYYQTRNRLWFSWRYGTLRTKLTTFRYGLQLLLSGTQYQRKALQDLLTGTLGKQPVL